MECFAIASNNRPMLEDDALLQFALRLPGLPQDSFHGAGLGETFEYGLMEQQIRSLTNTAISDSVHQEKDIVSRRFSFGLSGASSHKVTKSIFDDSDRVQPMRNSFDLECAKGLAGGRFGMEKGKLELELKSPLSPMKVSTNFFEDVRPPAVRRSSIDSVESFANESVCDDDDEMASAEGTDESSYLSNVYRGYERNDEESPLALTNAVSQSDVVRPIHHVKVQQPNVDSFRLMPSNEFTEIFKAFTSSMTKSMESQQAIHAWDRKMGLKRSHSKTMRLSMRSRKRLKIIFKRELGNALKAK